MRTNTLSALLVIVIAMGFSLNETFGGEIKAFEATFEEVQTACDNTKGCEMTIYPDGGFDANTDDTTIQCTGLGMCIGWNDEARRPPAVVGWNKATKTTFVGVMSTQSRRQANCPNILAKVRVLDQKSRGLIAKLSPASKSTAVKSLIRRSRSAKSMRSAKMAKLKRRARAKMLGRQRHLAALTEQLNRNTKQRKNLWRQQCNAKVGSKARRQMPGSSRPGLAAPYIPGGAVQKRR